MYANKPVFDSMLDLSVKLVDSFNCEAGIDKSINLIRHFGGLLLSFPARILCSYIFNILYFWK
jgi:hypothetical protein